MQPISFWPPSSYCFSTVLVFHDQWGSSTCNCPVVSGLGSGVNRARVRVRSPQSKRSLSNQNGRPTDWCLQRFVTPVDQTCRTPQGCGSWLHNHPFNSAPRHFLCAPPNEEVMFVAFFVNGSSTSISPRRSTASAPPAERNSAAFTPTFGSCWLLFLFEITTYWIFILSISTVKDNVIYVHLTLRGNLMGKLNEVKIISKYHTEVIANQRSQGKKQDVSEERNHKYITIWSSLCSSE